MKKRGLSVILLICLMVALTACGFGSSKYAKGTLKDTSFESEWIGVRFDAPEGFIVATQEELDEFLDIGSEMLEEVYADDGKNVIDYSELTTVYELLTYQVMEDGTGNPNLTLAVERTALTVDKYMDALKKQVNTIYNGTTLSWEETEKVSVGSLECDKYTVCVDYGYAMMYQSYYMAKKDNRMIYFILTYSDDQSEAATALMNAFKAY